MGGSSSPNEAEYEVQNVLLFTAKQQISCFGTVQKCYKLRKIEMMCRHSVMVEKGVFNEVCYQPTVHD